MDKEDKNLLELLGIEIRENQVSIDFEKAKSTLKSISQKLDKTASKIREDLKEGRIEIPSVDIEMNPKKFEIDLEQTKQTIDSLIEKLSNLATATVDDIQTSTPKEKNQESDSSDDEPNKNKKSQDFDDSFAYVYFEIDSPLCQKEKISKIIGFETGQDRKNWRLSSPKIAPKQDDIEEAVENLTKLLESRIDSLDTIKKECKASFSLVVELSDFNYLEKISLAKLPTKFLDEIGANLLLKRA